MPPTKSQPSEFVSKGHPCEACGSSDAVALYDDGHTHCFSCGSTIHQGHAIKGGAVATRAKEPSVELAQVISSGRHAAIKSRKITQASCKFWDYRVRQTPNGHFQQLATYRDAAGTPVGVKIRDTGPDGSAKEFSWAGSAHGNLYGRHLWGSGGRMLTIAEGEIDTISISQCNDHKYPVVGVPNGAHEAAKAVAQNLEWITGFDKTIIWMDADRQGQEAAQAIAEILPPGKAFIVHTPSGYKDASDMLQADQGALITKAIWDARPFRPDGIIDARDLTEACMGSPEWGTPWPWEEMTKWTYGRHLEELIVFGAGYGIGKTDILSEIIASTIKGETRYGLRFVPEGFAVFGYEAGAATTKKAIAGKLAGRRFHIPQDDSGASWTDQELRDTLSQMDHEIWDAGGKLFINDSKGSANWETVQSRIRYLYHAEGVINFAIDPLSAMVLAAEGSEDERKLIDRIILEAAQLTVELRCRIMLFSHLTRPALGPSHEEGGQVHGNQFRGSNAIGMFANFLMGGERNTQAETDQERSIMTIRMIKDRFTGNSAGHTFKLVYDALQGTYDVPATNDLFGATGDV